MALILTTTLPDGREVELSYAAPTGGWVARLVQTGDRTASGRSLLTTFTKLLDLPHGPKPPWMLEIIEGLTGYETPAGRRYACPCCDFLTLTQPPPGTYAICPVCVWEDDWSQFEDPDYVPGPNKVSLNHARENFRRHGASELRLRGHGRPPHPEEQPPGPA